MEVNGIREGVLKLADDGSPVLIGSKCYSCGKISFPRKAVCPFCMEKGESEVIHIGKTGKLVNFTTCYTAPAGFQAPYSQGIVEVDEGVTILTLLDHPNDQLKLQKNAPVTLVISPVSTTENGEQVLGWKYRVSEGEKHD